MQKIYFQLHFHYPHFCCSVPVMALLSISLFYLFFIRGKKPGVPKPAAPVFLHWLDDSFGSASESSFSTDQQTEEEGGGWDLWVVMVDPAAFFGTGGSEQLLVMNVCS